MTQICPSCGFVEETVSEVDEGDTHACPACGAAMLPDVDGLDFDLESAFDEAQNLDDLAAQKTPDASGRLGVDRMRPGASELDRATDEPASDLELDLPPAAPAARPSGKTSDDGMQEAAFGFHDREDLALGTGQGMDAADLETVDDEYTFEDNNPVPTADATKDEWKQAAEAQPQEGSAAEAVKLPFEMAPQSAAKKPKSKSLVSRLLNGVALTAGLLIGLAVLQLACWWILKMDPFKVAFMLPEPLALLAPSSLTPRGMEAEAKKPIERFQNNAVMDEEEDEEAEAEAEAEAEEELQTPPAVPDALQEAIVAEDEGRASSDDMSEPPVDPAVAATAGPPSEAGETEQVPPPTMEETASEETDDPALADSADAPPTESADDLLTSPPAEELAAAPATDAMLESSAPEAIPSVDDTDVSPAEEEMPADEAGADLLGNREPEAPDEAGLMDELSADSDLETSPAEPLARGEAPSATDMEDSIFGEEITPDASDLLAESGESEDEGKLGPVTTIPISRNDLAAANAQAAEALDALAAAQATPAGGDDIKQKARSAYIALAGLGKAAALVEPNDAGVAEVLARSAAILQRVAESANLRRMVGTSAMGWIKSGKGDGVILSGAIVGSRTIGKYVEVDVHTPGKPATLTCLFPGNQFPDADDRLAVGRNITIFGYLVKEPATALHAYSGQASEVIWSHHGINSDEKIP